MSSGKVEPEEHVAHMQHSETTDATQTNEEIEPAGVDDDDDVSSNEPGDLDEKDIHEQFEFERPSHLTRALSKASTKDGPINRQISKFGGGAALTRETTTKNVISFSPDDPGNPANWPTFKKIYVVFVAIMTVANSTIASSICSGASEEFSAYFHITNTYALVLPTSIYLFGYVVGPFVFGPFSEHFGRKWVMLVAFMMYTIFTLACAVADSFASMIVFRFFVGVAGACPIAVVGGICADVYHDPAARGRAMAVFMACTTFGPVLGPIISGFIAVVSWRWIYWVCLILAGATWIPLLLYPETYAPVVLKQRAKKIRKETGNQAIKAPMELERADVMHIIQVVLTRPVRMLISEPIVNLTCLYLSVTYGMFYIFFQSYPVIFGGIYGFNAGEQGLAFIPIGIGAVIACCLYLWWDYILRNAQEAKKPWALNEEYRRLPLACLAGPFFVLSFFWAGWTADPPNGQPAHWLAPVAAGIPFGIGYLLLFMALLNYLVDAYEIFAASSMAAASTTRSTFGAVLPFAAPPMYDRLGVAWACSLLGFIAVALCFVPFIFIKFGKNIRARSPFCQFLERKKKEDAEKEDRRRRRRAARDEEEAIGERTTGLEGVMGEGPVEDAALVENGKERSG